MPRSEERLMHFQCSHCKGWWTIGDAHLSQQYRFYCPFCCAPEEGQDGEEATD